MRAYPEVQGASIDQAEAPLNNIDPRVAPIISRIFVIVRSSGVDADPVLLPIMVFAPRVARDKERFADRSHPPVSPVEADIVLALNTEVSSFDVTRSVICFWSFPRAVRTESDAVITAFVTVESPVRSVPSTRAVVK